MSMFVLHSQAPPGFPSENPFLLQVDTNQLSFLSYKHLLRSTKDEVTKKVSWYYVEKPDFFYTLVIYVENSRASWGKTPNCITLPRKKSSWTGHRFQPMINDWIHKKPNFQWQFFNGFLIKIPLLIQGPLTEVNALKKHSSSGGGVKKCKFICSWPRTILVCWFFSNNSPITVYYVPKKM